MTECILKMPKSEFFTGCTAGAGADTGRSKCLHLSYVVHVSGHAVKHRTVNRGDGGSIPPTAVSKFRQFHSPHICLCLLEETLKAGGPFYQG